MWIVSRDCGHPQINIPARLIGTDTEWSLRTESKDEAVWRPVAENAAKAYHDLYMSPMWRDGKLSYRFFQPSVGYTSGWATFKEWWTWRHVGGVGVGPWIKTGRFLQRAICGAANYKHLMEKSVTDKGALSLAKQWQQSFGVEGVLDVKDSPSGRIVYWQSFPKMPTEPPADGNGPRPRPNDGK
jgi:hypothetical protein